MKADDKTKGAYFGDGSKPFCDSGSMPGAWKRARRACSTRNSAPIQRVPSRRVARPGHTPLRTVASGVIAAEPTVRSAPPVPPSGS